MAENAGLIAEQEDHFYTVKKWLHIRQRWHEIRKWPAQWRWMRRNPAKPKRAILVAGYQRSGTNMLMKALDQHPLTSVFHENDPRVFSDYALKPDDQLEKHFRRAPGHILVIKCLLDAHRYQSLSELLTKICGQTPQILWPMRALDDLVNSHMVRWPDNREQVDEILGANQITTWRGRGLSAETRAQLRDLYRPDISNADCKAIGWLMRNSLVLNADFPRASCLLINYEDLVTQPDTMLQKLLAHIQLDWNPVVAEGIHARSISKNDPPQLDPSIREACTKLANTCRDVLQSLT